MMTSLLFGMPQGAEWLIILFVVLLIFGSTRLPQLARGMGKSIKEFKKGINESGDDDEVEETRRARELRAGETARTREDELAPDKLSANKPR
ncbi:MAG TPA: twin-arginine translocase TatA/TatE family subunit [Pyrinomonadaceae bacterium]